MIAAFAPERLTFAINTQVAKMRFVKFFLSLAETYPIDPARVTLQGEKGTARLAWYIALHNPDRFAGVLGARAVRRAADRLRDLQGVS